MSIGGFRATHAARLLFNQNTQEYTSPSGEIHYGPRPWAEPWILSFCGTASSLMLAGGIGLLGGRRWGLTFAAMAGLSWISSAIGYVLSSFWFIEKARLWSHPKFSHYALYLVAEVAIGAVAISVGLLFVTLEWRPRWAGFDAVVQGRKGRLAVYAFVAWGLVSIAASTVFTRWLLSRI